MSEHILKVGEDQQHEIKIYVWICPKCQKVIQSFYPREFELNKHAHTIKHLNQEKEEKKRSKLKKEGVKKK